MRAPQPPPISMKTLNDKLDSIYITLLRIAGAQIRQLNQESKTQEKLMATLADIEAAVAAENTISQSVVTLLGQLSSELQAAIASNDPAQMQALVDQINANAAALSAAVEANTPAPAAEPPAEPTA